MQLLMDLFITALSFSLYNYSLTCLNNWDFAVLLYVKFSATFIVKVYNLTHSDCSSYATYYMLCPAVYGLLQVCAVFQIKTKTDYIIQRTDYSKAGKRYSISMPYVCQLSHKNKSPNSLRSLGCKSRLHLKLRNKPKTPKDANAKDGFVFLFIVMNYVRQVLLSEKSKQKVLAKGLSRTHKVRSKTEFSLAFLLSILAEMPSILV